MGHIVHTNNMRIIYKIEIINIIGDHKQDWTQPGSLERESCIYFLVKLGSKKIPFTYVKLNAMTLGHHVIFGLLAN